MSTTTTRSTTISDPDLNRLSCRFPAWDFNADSADQCVGLIDQTL